VSNLQQEPRSPRAEFLLAIVGPLTSLVIGGVCLLVAGLFLPLSMDVALNPGQAFAPLTPLTTLLLWLGPINLLLGVFNLLPGFPLDGGRVLRAILWGVTGNFRMATRWAAAVGQGFAWLLIFSGIATIFGADSLLRNRSGQRPVAGLYWLVSQQRSQRDQRSPSTICSKG
jgi:Zn-dependent protease